MDEAQMILRDLIADISNPKVVWIFDYDLTLYSWREYGVLHSLDRKINDFIIHHFGVDNEQANEVRKKYWQEHGTTLAGLMQYEDIRPHDYFDFIHADELLQMPLANPNLRMWIDQIQGTKIIFSNARRDWVDRGLKTIGLDGCFDGIYDLEFFDWIGKPMAPSYDKLIRELDLSSKRVYFFEDKLDNLLEAKKKGWLTIWLQGMQNEQASDAVNLTLKSLEDLWL